jgi:hypothetical protein
MSPPDTAALFAEVRALLHAARAAAARQVNTLLVLTNYEIGRRIVEREQGGEARAEYGAGVIQSLSARLTQESGPLSSVDDLTLMRTFYLAYRVRLPKSETPSQESSTRHHDGSPLQEFAEWRCRRRTLPRCRRRARGRAPARRGDAIPLPSARRSSAVDPISRLPAARVAPIGSTRRTLEASGPRLRLDRFRPPPASDRPTRLA